MTTGAQNDPGRIGRRTLLRGGLLGGAGAVALATGVSTAAPGEAAVSADGPGAAGAGSPGSARSSVPVGDLVESFHGPHQPGILTPPQPHAAFVALDLDAGSGREQLARLMRVWTEDIARLMAGRSPVTDQEPELTERVSGLTVTVGWGAGAFEKAGLQAHRPSWLRALPSLPIDELDERWGEADLLLQVAAYSPVTVAHARRHLVNAAVGIARTRWIQPGYREPMERHGWSMRNQMGQVDGTVQPDVTPEASGRDLPLVLIDGDGADPFWRGGSSLVLRRIEMDMDGWARADRVAREHMMGRDLATGAPMTGGDVDTPVDLHATHPNGLTVIDGAAHVRRAAPHAPHERFLRRPYLYEDVAPDGSTDTGLLFTAYQADPVRQFLPVQQRLAEADLLNIYTTPVGSAVFALLPGCPEGGWLGQDLLV